MIGVTADGPAHASTNTRDCLVLEFQHDDAGAEHERDGDSDQSAVS